MCPTLPQQCPQSLPVPPLNQEGPLRMKGFRLKLLVSCREAAPQLPPLIVLLRTGWSALGLGRGFWAGRVESGLPGQKAEAVAEQLLLVWPG